MDRVGHHSPIVLGLGFIALAALVAVSYWTRLRDDNDIGLTTEVALLLAFVLGAAAVLAEKWRRWRPHAW